MDTARTNVMCEHLAKLIIGHLPDKRCFMSKPRKARQGICGRATADFTGRTHMRI